MLIVKLVSVLGIDVPSISNGLSTPMHIFNFFLCLLLSSVLTGTYAPTSFIVLFCWDLYDNQLFVAANKGTFASGFWGPGKIPRIYIFIPCLIEYVAVTLCKILMATWVVQNPQMEVGRLEVCPGI